MGENEICEKTVSHSPLIIKYSRSSYAINLLVVFSAAEKIQKNEQDYAHQKSSDKVQLHFGYQ